MNTLTQCSKILYDHNLLDKQRELEEYKQSMMQPILYFNNKQELEHKKQIMFEILFDAIRLWYSDEEFLDYATGITDNDFFQKKLYNVIYNSLQTFFNESTWLSTLVFHMCIGFETIIPNYIKENKWRMQWTSICKIIYTSIQEQLDILVFVGNSSDFFRFKCNKCQHIYRDFNIVDTVCRNCIIITDI